jgi:hypothetical protein
MKRALQYVFRPSESNVVPRKYRKERYSTAVTGSCKVKGKVVPVLKYVPRH